MSRHILLFAILVQVAACSPLPADGPQPTAATSASPTVLGWSEPSHAKGATPAYAEAFPQEKVAEFKITVTAGDWQKMLDNMTKLYGARGTGQGGPRGAFGPGGAPPGGLPGQQPGFRPPQGANPGEMPGVGVPGAGGPGLGVGRPPKEKPMWVPATITYNGRTWLNVGFRFKGNSSLMSAWQSGADKIPFKLSFDKLEDEHPEIKDQRFFGFKQLALSTNWNDASYMRDAISSAVIADAGLPAAKTAFYQVQLDHGAGAASLGIYTAIEVIDDTVIARVFGEDEGNIYEGDGQAASLAEGTRGQIAASFQKENHEDEANWGDVEKLYDALHAAQRTTDPKAWRAGLEAIFDVDGFLRWLAVAAALQHWDTYGGMTHNFYLYNNPATSRLTWISWDHNLVLGASGGPGGGARPVGAPPPLDPAGFPMPFVPGGAPPPLDAAGAIPPAGAPPLAGRPGGVGGPGGPGGRSASLDKKDVAANWPLIRFLMDDSTYYASYVTALRQTIDGPFEQEKMLARYQHLAGILRPYAEGPSYDAAVQGLSDATKSQITAVQTFLATQPKP